jgi:nucleoside 2-deoxyribosyltransferase
MSFAKEMLETQAELRGRGHEVNVPLDAEIQASPEQFFDSLEEDRKFCIETDIMRKCMKLIDEADGVLVLNHEKNGLPGYIGTSALMELGLAHYLNKKIYLLHPVPSPEVARWAHEVLIFQPEVLNGDISKIA